MSILWDSPLTAAVAAELHQALRGDRLTGHTFDWDRRELLLHFRAVTVRWCLHPGAGWVLKQEKGEEEEPGPGFRPLSAELEEVVSPPDERWLSFRFRKRRGLTRQVEVILELMTNQWNGLLVEGPERWIRHVLWTRHLEDRSLEVGQAYRPPLASQRLGIGESLAEEELDRIVARLLGEQGPRGLLNQLAFTSTLNLDALLGHHPVEPRTRGKARIDRTLWLRLRDLSNLDPCVLHTEAGGQPYPVGLTGLRHSRTPSLLSAFEACAGEESQPRGSRTLVEERVAHALHQARGRIRGLRRELDHAGDPAETRERANLLLARLGEVEKGASTVELQGFRGEPVILRLDPSLSPHENAEALYEEAARQERALERIPKLLVKAEALAERIRTLEKKMKDGELSPGEVDSQLPTRRGRGRRPGSPPPSRLPYHTFVSSGGLEIRVGRGPRDNDALTFRHASPDDIWLHARDTSGAHVVLRWGRSQAPPSKDVQEAAVLAALHSGGRGAGVVPVDWTRKKYVRKPRKAPAGTVIPERVQTLFVTPDPGLPQRLREDREDGDLRKPRG